MLYFLIILMKYNTMCLMNNIFVKQFVSCLQIIAVVLFFCHGSRLHAMADRYSMEVVDNKNNKLKQKEYRKALNELETARKNTRLPADLRAEIQYKIADIYDRTLHDYPKALTEYKNFISKYGMTPGVRFIIPARDRITVLEVLSGDVNDASAVIEALRRTEIVQDRQELNKEIALLEKIKAGFPDKLIQNNVYNLLALRYFKNHQWKKAAECYEYVINADKKAENEYFKKMLGICKFEYKKWNLFITAYVVLFIHILCLLLARPWLHISRESAIKMLKLATGWFIVWAGILVILWIKGVPDPRNISKDVSDYVAASGKFFVFLWYSPFGEPRLWYFLLAGYLAMGLAVLGIFSLKNIKYYPARVLAGCVNTLLVSAVCFFLFYYYVSKDLWFYSNGYIYFFDDIETVYYKHPHLFPDVNKDKLPPKQENTFIQ